MPRGLQSRIIVAFVLAALCFFASTLYSESVSRNIDRASLSIASDAMPSIEYLSDTRSELHRLNIAAWRYLLESRDQRPNALAEVESARRGVDEAFEHYLALPTTYPGEQALWADMHRELSRVDRVVEEVLATHGGGDSETLGLPVTAAVDAASDAIRREIDLNAAAAQDLAVRIEDGHRHATRLALLLDLLSTLFTALAAYLTVRALRHHHRVVAERNDLLTRRAEELERFAGRVAHDVLGPLSATRLAVSHAASQVSEPNVRRSLERGQRGVERVSTIVDGLLRFARAGARPDPGVVTTVAPVVQSVVAELEPIAAEARVTLTLHPVPSCSIYGHAGVLTSVIENLTRNAIKYMGERDERRVDVRVAAQRDFVRFEVRDTGPGIPAALVDRVFDAHVRGRDTHQPGIGLGLATVKRIAEAHGGRVGVVTRVGEGSTFWCELPRADNLADAPPAPATKTSDPTPRTA